MTPDRFNRLMRQIEEVAGEQEDRLALVYEKAIRDAARFYARQFENLTAAGEWVPPAGWPDFDTTDALDPAREAREAAARRIEETLAGLSAEIAISFDPEKFSVFSESLLASLGQQASANFTAEMTETLAKTVRQSFDQGLSVPQTAKAIRQGIGGVSAATATMLARTDLVSLANGGSYLAARKVFAGTATSKKWINTHDARTRPTHVAAGDQVVPMDQPFQVGGYPLQYPGDPAGPPAEVINCRCTFVVEEGTATTRAPAEEEVGVPKGEMAQEIFGTRYRDTEQMFSVNGEYTEARRPLHQQIAASFLREGRAVRGQPRTVFMAGGSGSGKTTVMDIIDDEIPNRVLVDPDAVKALLPEYRRMVDAGDAYAAFGVHEESSSLAKQILREANERRSNVVVDGTGDSGPGKFLDKIRKQQATGNDVEVVIVDVPTEVALERAAARAARTGRVVAEADIRNIHQNVAARFPEWRDTTDWQLWANEGTKPVLVARRVDGAEEIFDAPRLQQFIDKGTE